MVLPIFNGMAKTKLAILAFLYCREFVKNPDGFITDRFLRMKIAESRQCLKGFGYNIARSLGGVSFASFSKKQVLQSSSNNSTKHTCQSTIILLNLMFSWQKLFLSVFSFHQTNMLHCTTETWIPILGIDQ